VDRRLFSNRIVLIAVAALAWSGASAAAQSAAQALDPRELGKTEAVLDYCAKADPRDAGKIHARLQRMMKGASKESITEARQTQEYQKARQSEEDFLAKVDEHNAAHVCSQHVAATR
jgi:hypothetical protein